MDFHITNWGIATCILKERFSVTCFVKWTLHLGVIRWGNLKKLLPQLEMTENSKMEQLFWETFLFSPRDSNLLKKKKKAVFLKCDYNCVLLKFGSKNELCLIFVCSLFYRDGTRFIIGVPAHHFVPFPPHVIPRCQEFVMKAFSARLMASSVWSLLFL